MSGVPNPDGIHRVKELADEYNRYRREIRELGDIQKKMELCKESLREVHTELVRELEKMDITAPGNTGWSERFFEFILMIAEKE